MYTRTLKWKLRHSDDDDKKADGSVLLFLPDGMFLWRNNRIDIPCHGVKNVSLAAVGKVQTVEIIVVSTISRFHLCFHWNDHFWWMGFVWHRQDLNAKKHWTVRFRWHLQWGIAIDEWTRWQDLRSHGSEFVEGHSQRAEEYVCWQDLACFDSAIPFSVGLLLLVVGRCSQLTFVVPSVSSAG